MGLLRFAGAIAGGLVVYALEHTFAIRDRLTGYDFEAEIRDQQARLRERHHYE